MSWPPSWVEFARLRDPLQRAHPASGGFLAAKREEFASPHASPGPISIPRRASGDIPGAAGPQRFAEARGTA
jgi:hypothetical protein